MAANIGRLREMAQEFSGNKSHEPVSSARYAPCVPVPQLDIPQCTNKCCPRSSCVLSIE